jgi:hypothetical protein
MVKKIKILFVNYLKLTNVNVMAKLCPRGKAAAKRKFKVYPSAYANMYASAVCSGKVTPGGKNNLKREKQYPTINKVELLKVVEMF